MMPAARWLCRSKCHQPLDPAERGLDGGRPDHVGRNRFTKFSSISGTRLQAAA
jgi:hypothetical protein